MKWEYDYLYPLNRESIENSIAVMRDMGRDEWELVLVDNGIAYFRRELKFNTVQNVYRDGVKLEDTHE